MEKLLLKLKNKRGETLIEVIVSAAILIILMTTMVGLLMASIRVGGKALHLDKSDRNIIAEFDGTSVIPGSVVDTPASPSNQFVLVFDSANPSNPANIYADTGKYRVGNSVNGLQLKQFVPN